MDEHFILNYDQNTVEIQRLKDANGVYIFKENNFEDISLPLFIMTFGLGTFVYYRRKLKQ